MRRTLPCLLTTLLATLGSLSAQAKPPPLRLGIWNLEPHGLRVDPAGSDDAQAIAPRVQELGVALLAVTGVGSEAALRELCRRVGPGWDCVLGATAALRNGDEAQAGVGFLWDRGALELLHAEELLGLPRLADGLPILRCAPVSACFRAPAGPDFRAVVVRLQDGRSDEDARARSLEAAELRAWLQHLQARAGEDPDVVVFGACYCGDRDPPAEILAAGGLRFLRATGPAATSFLTERERETRFAAPSRGSAEAVDHVAPAAAFREVRADTLRVHNRQDQQDPATRQRTYGDHFPVTVDLDAVPDDDPKATFAAPPPEARLPLHLRPAGAPAALRFPDKTPRSPIAPGTSVVVFTRDDRVFTGVLVDDLPTGPSGWVVINSENRRVVLPLVNVIAVREQ